MQTTMHLLAKALERKSIAEWTAELDLSEKALYNAKYRGQLSPTLAGDLASRLGEDVERWIVIAAVESDRDSASKTRMLKRLETWRKR